MTTRQDLKILKVTKRGYDTYVTAKIRLPRSEIDGWGLMYFEISVEKILSKKIVATVRVDTSKGRIAFDDSVPKGKLSK